MFNLFNRASLTPPDNSLGYGATFDTVTSTSAATVTHGMSPDESFNIEFALKSKCPLLAVNRGRGISLETTAVLRKSP